MTKQDLVAYMAEHAGLTKADAERALNAMVDGVKTGLKKEGEVKLTGFVTFVAKKKPAKKGRNPRTGAPVKIPARVAVTVKAGSKLKEALN
ncbi:MAG: HU family DNA-binding protein [Bacilli bacterium]|nr:HU family DNA-binding protein [Bacilli bacterium]